MVIMYDFILSDLLCKVQKHHAANREGSFRFVDYHQNTFSINEVKYLYYIDESFDNVQIQFMLHLHTMYFIRHLLDSPSRYQDCMHVFSYKNYNLCWVFALLLLSGHIEFKPGLAPTITIPDKCRITLLLLEESSV